MVKFYRWSLSIGVLFFGLCTRAGNSDRIGEAGAYELLINTQARTMGLMGINSANVRGIDALGSNIAGLAHNKGLSVFSNYTSWLTATGTSLFNVGVGGEVSPGNNIGFSIGYMTFGEIPRTSTINPEPLSTFSPFYLNLGLSYSRVFGRGVRAGITGKLINQSINNLSATGFALDAGMQYTTGQKEDFHFGVYVRNLGFPMKYSGDGLILNRPVPLGSSQYDLPFYNRAAKFELPTQFSIALSKDFYFGDKPSNSDAFCKPIHRLSASTNFIYNGFTPNNYGLGFEYALREQVSIRLGFLYEDNTFNKETTTRAHMGFAGGVSYDLKVGKDRKKVKNPTVLEISYNYRPAHVFGGTHNLGFVYFTNKYSYCDEYVIAKAAEVARTVEPEKKPEVKTETIIKEIIKYDTIFRDAPAKIETVTDYKKVNDMLKNFASNIEFRTGTAILTERGEGALMVVGEMIKNYPDTRFLIEGHTDNDGTPENNMRLSKLRAKTVARYLTEFKGIPEVNMKVEWYGETKPVADNSTEEGKQRNRRVEVKVLDAKLENLSRAVSTPASTVPKKVETKTVPAPTAPKVETPTPKKEITTPTSNIETSSDVPKKAPQDELNENANSITFKPGTDSLNRSGKRAITNVVNVLKDNPNLKIKIEAHTDNGKYALSNQELSEKMAKVVKDMLVQQGIDASRITVEALGDSKPKETNDSDIGRKNNRRIELKIVN
ncbi:MAG: PorV/PorQ family protein [Chitinophagales bacterium]|nr:PorV/PorQ family protein [Chitinophagales bacterium]